MITPKKSNQNGKKNGKKKRKLNVRREEKRWDEREMLNESKNTIILSVASSSNHNTLLSYFYFSFLSPSLYIFPRNKSKKLSLGIFLDLSITHLSLSFFSFEEIYYTSLPSLASLALICLVSFLLFLVKYRERFRHGLVCCFFW